MIDALPTAEIAARLVGPVFEFDHPSAAVEIATFNLSVQHRPELIVGAACAEDVVHAVRWAVAHGLPVAVQATGHGPVSPVNGGLLITTHRMRAVTIDPVRRLARVEAGARWSDVIAAAAVHGLAPLSGSSSHVGVVGYTLGGGIGPLARQYGFAADLVTSVSLVTADGELRVVDAQTEPALFWAVRGGKSNFGVVTEIEFGLVPVSTIFGGAVFYSGESAAEVLHAYRNWVGGLPEETTTSIALLRLPEIPSMPKPLRGTFVVNLRFAHNGTAQRGQELLAPMLAVGQILLQGVGAMPYSAADVIHQDPTDPMPTWEHSTLLRSLTGEAVDTLLAMAGPDVDVPLIMVELRQLGGALSRQPAVPNAVAGREGEFLLFVLGPMVPGLTDIVPAVGRQVIGALTPWSTGTSLLNFHGDATTPAKVATAWTPEMHCRLVDLKRTVDPANVFRFGHALV